MKKAFLVVLFLFSLGMFAQGIKISTKDNDLKLATLPYYSYGKGLGITSPDSIYQLNIRFRMQNRVSYIDAEDEIEAYDAQIRRLRLRFDGYVGNPKFLYAIQLSFAPGDVGPLEDQGNINIIRDAVVFYRPNKNWSIAFGQTKLPGNRQRVNSSGALQFTDRSINNARFNIDRDFGFQVYYLNENKDKFAYNIKSAITTGDGRNVTEDPDNGFALTGKLELFPLGSFTKDGSNFEGDIVREKTPKVLISGAFSNNHKARQTQGQLGSDLYEKKNMQSLLLDGMVKYNGWSFMTAYMNRMSDDPIAYNPDDISEFNFVYVGEGFDYQLSYLFLNKFELIGRYSIQTVAEDIKAYTPDSKQYSIGVTKYLWEHAFKLQTEFSFDQLTFANGNIRNSWFARFQVEIGI